MHKVKTATVVGSMSGTQQPPGVAPVNDLAAQRAIAAGLKPANSKAKQQGQNPMSNNDGKQSNTPVIAQGDQAEHVETSVQVEQVETVNQELPKTGLADVNFNEEVELDDEESLGESAGVSQDDEDFLLREEDDEDGDDEDEDAPDSDQYAGEDEDDSVDPAAIFDQGGYSALMPNYGSQKLNPVLVCTFNLTSASIFEGLKDQLLDVELDEGVNLNFWNPFQRAKEGSDVVPAFANPLRQVIQFLNGLPEENLRIVADQMYGNQIVEMLSTHVGQLVAWKLLNTHVDTEALELDGVVVQVGDDEEDAELIQFNEFIDAEGYSTTVSENPHETVSNNVVNVSMQIPALYAATRPDVVATKLVKLVEKMSGDLPLVVAFAFSSDNAVVDPDVRTVIDALAEEGFYAVSRETIELSLGEEAVLPYEIQPATSNAIDSLFLHGGDLLMVRGFAEDDAEGDEE